MRPTIGSENYSSLGMLIILKKVPTICIECNTFACKFTHIVFKKGQIMSFQNYYILRYYSILHLNRLFKTARMAYGARGPGSKPGLVTSFSSHDMTERLVRRRESSKHKYPTHINLPYIELFAGSEVVPVSHCPCKLESTIPCFYIQYLCIYRHGMTIYIQNY